MNITFERLVSRSVAHFLSTELDLAGVKTSVEKFLRISIIGGLALFILVSFIAMLYMKLNAGIAAIAGISAAAVLEGALYAILELRIDQRRVFVESILPDYLQLTAATIRSGIALDKAMVSSARPEFKYFSDDVKIISKQLYAGATMQGTLQMLADRYRSLQLQRAMRMIIESLRYGGGITDILNQIAKDLRTQATIQKEISGQLLLYSIFIAFAALIGAPALYALTNKMIGVTDKIWAGILAQNPHGLPSTGLSFLKPSPPQITPSEYYDFSLIAVIVISALASFIMSVISSGSVMRGVRFVPLFIIIGVGVFFVGSIIIGILFSSIGTAGG